MGIFGGGGTSNSDSIANRQLDLQQKEIESKRKSLFDQRIKIVKSQGAQDWGQNSPQKPQGNSQL